MSRLVIASGIALALSAGLVASPAAAEYGSNIPPSANSAEWNRMYRTTPPDWRPQGTVVAQAAFNPYPDGFGFYNYGGEQWANGPIFGIPAKTPGLSADAMRSLMGPAVCLGNNETGECTLTLPARRWKEAVDVDMNGGHCYGLAATAAILRNGTLTPQQFQPGVSRTYDLFPDEAVLQEINRNMASQYTSNDERSSLKPSQFVDLLRRNLGSRPSPYVASMMWDTGGHAVTPYAVYDRGNGRFDVAVYDNNYPDAGRAIHVDTVNETYEYLIGRNASGGQFIVSGTLELESADKISQRQDCPFCLGNNTVTLKLNAVKSGVPIKARILNLKGKPLKGVKKNRPLEPWQPGGLWNFPTFEIPKGKEFLVEINAKQRKKVLRTNITAVTGEFTFFANRVKVPKRSVGLLGVSPKTGKFTYAANSRDLGTIGVTDQRVDNSTIEVTAAAKGKTAPLGAQLKQRKSQVVLRTLDHRKGRAVVKAKFLALDADQNTVQVSASATTRLPKRARAVLSYGEWSLTDSGSVKLVVHKADGKTRNVRLKVTTRTL